MKLQTLQPAPGAKRTKKIIGRGTSSGHGKTSGFGHKGQKARSGRVGKRGFEGGQTPFYKKLPKIMRFKNYPFKVDYEVVNVEQLNRFDEGSTVDVPTLAANRMVSSETSLVKILGQGDIKKALHVKVQAVSSTAKEKIEAAGGSVEVVD
ncbi:50S ribosomal protein L15 [Coprothermobacter platensis]|uniref:50S ribosomal protein L15 n=1 Tax=Coprothermobacter platensis TaxID=108819 RepID=UPI000362009F|nr:50S ribosomal protein L15 [Coprothermobacter platensis]